MSKLDIIQMKIEIDDIVSYIENEVLEDEVMKNVLDRNESDNFETFGEMYAYLDGLLQHPKYN